MVTGTRWGECHKMNCSVGEQAEMGQMATLKMAPEQGDFLRVVPSIPSNSIFNSHSMLLKLYSLTHLNSTLYPAPYPSVHPAEGTLRLQATK